MATVNGTVAQDTWLDGNAQTTNRSSLALRVGDQGGSDGARTVMICTMPANPGGSPTITNIDLKLYCTNPGGVPIDINAYRGTSTPATNEVATQATWTIYSTGNNWTTLGGFSDYNSTIISTTTVTGSGSYFTFPLYGGSATNPITATWGDTIALMLRSPSSTAKQVDFNNSRGVPGTNYPILEVTYTTGAGQNSNFLMFM